MKNLHLVAVPNGVFSLDQALASEPIQEAIGLLQNMEAPEKAKIKTLLSLYQMVDTLAQLDNQGFDLHTLNMDSLRESMKSAIDLGYDSIMKTFTEHERKKLRELVKKPGTPQ